MNESLREVRPVSFSTPDSCSELARALGKAIEKFETWGITVEESGRLYEAQQWLKHVAKADSFGETESELIRTGEAMDLATDFFQIAFPLGDSRARSIREELEKSFGGSLLKEDKISTPYDLQAQYWLGALLAQSELPVIIPGNSWKGQKPDFLIDHRALRFSVEVKCPTSYNALKARAEKAGSQIADSGLPGIIVMDVTQLALSHDRKRILLSDSSSELRQKVHEILISIHEQLETNVAQYLTVYPQSAKFNRVLLLVSIVRYWQLTNRSGFVKNFDLACCERPKACSGLLREVSFSLQDALLRGTQNLFGKGSPKT